MPEPWIHVFSGGPVDLGAPKEDQIHLPDIAWALAHLCRFVGHTKRFYSVAEHSVHTSKMVPKEEALRGLLHDAAEAYVGDMSAPLKHLPELSGYRRVEERVQKVIEARFGISTAMTMAVREADLRILATEMAQLFGEPPRSWDLPFPAYPRLKLPCWEPEKANFEFLARWHELTQ